MSASDPVVFITDNNQTVNFQYEDLISVIDEIIKNIKVPHLDSNTVASKVYPKLKTNNTMEEVENQIISTASELVTLHFDYPRIAVYIIIQNLHETTSDDFYEVVLKGAANITKKNNKPVKAPIYNEAFVEFVGKYRNEINAAFDYSRDYNISIFGYRTLERAYLKKLSNGEIIERPQHMDMRCAIAIHMSANYPSEEYRLKKIFESYQLMSKGFFTHATPTKFNAGTTRQQMSSCFLLSVFDSMDSIKECWSDSATISKYGGGLGINFTPIRVNGAYIKSTQGVASGLRLLTVFNMIAKYADQGGKKPGSIACYLEPWHGDIYFFLDLKKNTGAETERARDLFFGLMVNDIFMQRVEEDGVWSLMCPSQCPDLIGKFGAEFTKIYEKYESEGNFLKQIRAQDLWFKIMESQIETGTPYIVYKDHVNYKSNQINIGVINGSNLCAEIVEYSDDNEIAVCNLASICLPKFVYYINGIPEFNFQELANVARIATRNLNNIIDMNFYPVEKTRVSNLKHRPIGVGVQGLADVYALFKTPFDSDQAKSLNKKIFETIYYGCLTESHLLAKEQGPYTTFAGSPISEGKFQFDLWNMSYDNLSGMWDWETLRENIKKDGVRNSLTTTCMPTASTSQILGNNECIEPYTQNIYTRNTTAGDYYVVNAHLMKELMALGLWDQDMIDHIKYFEGSISRIPNIPDEIKQIYRTVWEIPQKSIIEMSADRAPFVDQTQSLNIFMENPTFVKLTSAHYYGWRKGLKTGMYYLRSKPSSEAGKFGIDIEKINVLDKLYGKRTIIKKEKKDVEVVCKYIPGKKYTPGECDLCFS